MKRSKKSKRSKRANRGWGQVFKFVKLPKVEPPRDSVYGCVLAALRKVKQGTVGEITAAAVDAGLARHTKQNHKTQTQIKLRRLVRLGSATKARPDKKEKKTKVEKNLRSKKDALKRAEKKLGKAVKPEAPPPALPA